MEQDIENSVHILSDTSKISIDEDNIDPKLLKTLKDTELFLERSKYDDEVNQRRRVIKELYRNVLRDKGLLEFDIYSDKSDL